MKHVNFLMVALLVMMSAMVTSCMNGEENTIVQGLQPMRVKSSYIGMSSSFVSGGIELIPTNSTLVDLPSETKIALVAYKYDRALQEVNENTKKLNVELWEKPQVIDAPLNISEAKDAYNDVVATHAISTMSFNGGFMVPYLMPVSKGALYASSPAEYFLIAPIGYRIQSLTDNDKLTAELRKHAFTIVCYLDELEGTDLILHLRHTIEKEADDKEVDRIREVSEYKAFDMTSAINAFKKKVGSYPTKVIVKSKENSNSNKLTDGSTRESTYEVKLDIKE